MFLSKGDVPADQLRYIFPIVPELLQVLFDQEGQEKGSAFVDGVFGLGTQVGSNLSFFFEEDKSL